MGTPEFAVSALEGLIEGGYPVVGVYTNPDSASGRGQKLSVSPIKKVALARNLLLYQPAGLKSADEIERLAKLAPDLVVVAAYGQLLPPQILKIPKHGSLNVHPSLVPRHRGPSPVSASILMGDEMTGVTIMLLDEGMDTGPVLVQEQEPVLPDDTTGSLSQRLAAKGARLLLRTIPRWVNGEIRPLPQDGSRASYSRVMNKEDGEIEWKADAVEIERRIRAFQPWPGCYTRWKGKILKVTKAAVGDGGGSQPGKVIVIPGARDGAIGVVVGRGTVILRSVQMEGKKEMPAEDFARGQRDFVGALLPDPGRE